MARWKAKDLVQPIWQRWGEDHKIDKAPRDALAQKLGTTGTTLSALNTGSKWMTLKMARRIAEETGVSVLELGAPLEEADEAGQSMLDRLQELAVKLGDSVDRQLKTEAKVRRLQARVRVLEAAREGTGAVAKGQATTG